MILQLKNTPGIYLVGFMGSGKSTVGRRLAGNLGWALVAAARLFPQIVDAQLRRVNESHSA